MPVRRALAEALASAQDAPRHIIAALASDLPEIAAIVLTRSPVLSDVELVACAAIGGELAQIALARRRALNADAAAPLGPARGPRWRPVASSRAAQARRQAEEAAGH